MDSSVQLSGLRLDGGTQPRTLIDQSVVEEYAERIKAGDEFPPVDVFYDGNDRWLADGFHRVAALKLLDKKVVECRLHRGGLRDAVLFSCGANRSHGQRRTNADKRKAVLTLLQDDEWSKFSDGKVAEICGVDRMTVKAHRDQLANFATSHPTKRTGKDGKQYPTARKPRQDERTRNLEFQEEDYSTTSVEREPPSNAIGEMYEAFDSYMDELLAGRPPHFEVALKDHARAWADS